MFAVLFNTQILKFSFLLFCQQHKTLVVVQGNAAAQATVLGCICHVIKFDLEWSICPVQTEFISKSFVDWYNFFFMYRQTERHKNISAARHADHYYIYIFFFIGYPLFPSVRYKLNITVTQTIVTVFIKIRENVFFFFFFQSGSNLIR